MHKQKHFFETILAKLQSGIIVLDLEGRIIMVNDYIAEFCGLPVEQFPGKSLNVVSPKLYEKILTGRTTGETVANVCDSEKPIGFNLSPLTDESGKPIGTIINLKDLSEIVEIRNDLRQKQRLAAIGEIVGKVAHEMRNPLFGITAAAQILEMELPLAESHKGLMDSLLRESQRLNRLVEVLQECTSEIQIQKQRVDLILVLDESVRDLTALLQERGVSLRQHHDREIWIDGDGEKLKRAIVHLLRNAIEASPPGGEVTLSSLSSEAGVVVTVTDQGPGVLPENFEKIFDVFYTTRKNHSGLGLSSCRNIVTAHGGRLTPLISPSGGMEFLLQLPQSKVRR